METKPSKKYPLKVPHRPVQTERGLQWLKRSFGLPDNSTKNSDCLLPKKGGRSYRRRRMTNKQSNKTLHHSSASTEQLKRSTKMQHLLQAFLTKQNLIVVWLNKAIIDLCQGFCSIKDIRVYIVIWIIYKNVATEIAWLQKNMAALQNLAPSENLSPPCPSENSAPSW